jgi:hypothetical protein
VAFSDPDSVQVDGRVLHGHATAAVTKKAGRVSVELQYLYLLGDTFVKVRGTVPADNWEKTDVPNFARQLAALLARQR